MKLRRTLAFLLTLAMVFSALSAVSIPAYAASIEGTISGNASWSDGDTVGTVDTVDGEDVQNGVTISGTSVITVTGTVSIKAPITITGNVTLTGGGKLVRTQETGNLIKVSGGTLTLEDITIDGGGIDVTTKREYSAIYVSSGNVRMKDGAALTNHLKTTENRGSAVYMEGGKFTMDGGTISGCKTRLYGGAVYLGDGSEFIMNSGTIENNKTVLDSQYGGGAIYVRSKLTVNGGTIQNNSSYNGGAIYNSSYGTTIINGGIIRNNTATNKGAAIFHSCVESVTAVLKIGGNANIDPGNDIYLDNSSSSDKYLEITSAIKNPMKLTVANPAEDRVIAAPSSGVTLTYNDMAQLSMTDSSWHLKLDEADNQIKLSKTESGGTKTIYFGYNANGGTFTGSNDAESAVIAVDGGSHTFTITSTEPTREGYKFLGWARTATATSAEFTAGNTITVSENTSLYAVWQKTQNTNRFTTSLSIDDWTYGDTAKKPTAAAAYGTCTYKYSTAENGTYTATVPSNAGTYWVKAYVAATSDYSGLESDPVSFKINKKTISKAINLTAPVAGAAPKTEITGDGYRAAVAWSPSVSGNFAAGTAYTATVTITPDANHTTEGIAANGYTVSGATVTNTANSNIATITFPATAKNANSFTTPLSITGWTYGDTASVPTAAAKYGTCVFTYSDAENGTYAAAVPTNAGTYWVKATVAETATYEGLEDKKSFTIAPKTIGKAINLTAPVRGAAPTTSITGDGYRAAVAWSPSVSGNFAAGTAYTATVTITTDANHTTDGIAANGYTVSGATVTNAANSNIATITFPATDKNANSFTTPLSITGWTYGDTANAPTAAAKYGDCVFTYSDAENGTYTTTVPTDAGTYWVKATVAATATYEGIESKKSFTIAKKTINAAINLTAPVLGAAPKTEIDGDGYRAAVAWSPSVSGNFAAGTVYTATVTITPDANHTTTGIAANGYTVSGATVTNTANSNIATITFPATEKNANSFTAPLSITGWTYGDTANAPTAAAEYGTCEFTYSDAENGTYAAAVPSNAGTYWVKATVAETATYKGLEDKISFTIARKTINATINLTAPVRGAAPTTEITGDGYRAAVVWSPSVSGNFAAGTVYTATVTITPDTNHTTTGIAANGYTVSGATVTNTANSNIATITFPATEKNANSFTTPLSITGWTFGDTANAPTAAAEYGTCEFTYSDTENGTYTTTVPTDAGTYWVKATVAATATYEGLEDKKSFTIAKKTINAAINLTAPVRGAAPQTVIDGDGYRAAVAWSPSVSGNFAAGTVYTATVTITPDANHTTDGIAANGYTVSGATVANTANSNIATVTFPATEKNANSFTTPLSITGWTYGDTANAPTAAAEYGDCVFTYSNAENGTYTTTVPTNAGTYWVKATVAETATYEGLEDKKSFTIAKKTINAAINLTAPVRYETPQTVIDGDGYSAAVAWSPSVSGNFAANTVYVATVSITPDANHTTEGIAEDGYTAVGADRVINLPGSSRVEFVYPKTGKETNEFTAPLSITGWTYGDAANAPAAEAKHGDCVFTYSDAENGTYTETAPTNAGTYWVKATVAETEEYEGIISTAVSFTIAPKIIDTAIDLTAPVRNAVPQTEVTGDGYTAAVTWSPAITGGFASRTIYTATVVITTDANHTTTGIAANSYTADGADQIANAADSNTVTITYPQTGSPSGTARLSVSFETNGGSRVSTRSVVKGSVLSMPADPTKDGYIFDGWYTDKKLTQKYDPKTQVTNGFTLYAKWTEDKDSKDDTKDDTKDDNDTKTDEDTWKNPFSDVKESDWFFEDVRYAVENGLFRGISDNEFAPNGLVTRGMFVTVLYRADGEKAVSSSTTFADVADGAYYAKAVAWGHKNGIIKGFSDTEFAPDRNITREQIAAIMHRYAKYKNADVSVGENTNILSYADFGNISEYAIASMQYAVGSGLMKGKTETTLNPQDNATRAETAAIVERFIESTTK